MRLRTRFELEAKSLTELRLIHKEVVKCLNASRPCSAERIAASKSLQNIEREIHLKIMSPKL